MDTESALKAAKCMGFSHAKRLSPATLSPLAQVREMCAADRCGLYAKRWTCPPACGSIEECAKRLSAYREGIILQTVSKLEDEFDYEGMRTAEDRHRTMFSQLANSLSAVFPNHLALSAGGCRLCESCTYPESPCRHPGRAYSSMEGYGLLVSDVCEKNALAYYYGPGTVSFTGCILLY